MLWLDLSCQMPFLAFFAASLRPSCTSAMTEDHFRLRGKSCAAFYPSVRLTVNCNNWGNYGLRPAGADSMDRFCFFLLGIKRQSRSRRIGYRCRSRAQERKSRAYEPLPFCHFLFVIRADRLLSGMPDLPVCDRQRYNLPVRPYTACRDGSACRRRPLLPRAWPSVCGVRRATCGKPRQQSEKMECLDGCLLILSDMLE